jgi:transcriptional regulator of arginine metabolism
MMPKSLTPNKSHKTTKKPSQSLIEALHSLLLQGTTGTQEEIKSSLTAQGFEVNQSKISRLLRKVGAVKTNNERGEIVYSLPREPAPPPTTSPLKNLITNVAHNENCIVISTLPGAASLIARLLDHNLQKLGIIGTLAGDDTILVIPQECKKIAWMVKELKSFLSSMT